MRGAARRALAGLGAVVVLGTGGWALSGCQLSSGGGDTTQLIVDFSDRLAVNARNTVRTSCGDLPGISAVPPRSKDVSVYFDIQHANNREVNALGECVNQLATQQPSLGIRGYRIDDGSMS